MGSLRSLMPGGLLARGPHRASRMATVEGPRGISTRAAVFLRYIAYFLVIACCSAISHYCFEHVGKYLLGGKLMFGLSGLTVLAAALGTVFYVNQRNEIIEQTRHYVFGLMCLPGAVLALIMWGATKLAGPSPSGHEDQFLNVLFIGLPALYFCTVVIPPVLFIKMLAQIRTLHRSRLDDEEMMTLWTRQDGHQR